MRQSIGHHTKDDMQFERMTQDGSERTMRTGHKYVVRTERADFTRQVCSRSGIPSRRYPYLTISSVPSPWWASMSMIATRSTRSRACMAPIATLLKRQSPQPAAGLRIPYMPAWCPGGRTTQKALR